MKRFLLKQASPHAKKVTIMGTKQEILNILKRDITRLKDKTISVVCFPSHVHSFNLSKSKFVFEMKNKDFGELIHSINNHSNLNCFIS